MKCYSDLIKLYLITPKYYIFVNQNKKILKYSYLLLITLSILLSCQPDIGSDNVIIFGDIIGSYEGQCADYNTSTFELMNREDATLSVSVFNLEEASVKTTCDKFDDLQLKLKSLSSSEIIFEKIISPNSIMTLRYIALSDSIVLIKTGSGNDNFIFAGIRK